MYWKSIKGSGESSDQQLTHNPKGDTSQGVSSALFCSLYLKGSMEGAGQQLQTSPLSQR